MRADRVGDDTALAGIIGSWLSHLTKAPSEDRRQDIRRVRAVVIVIIIINGHVRRVDARWRDAGRVALSHAISVLPGHLVPVRASACACSSHHGGAQGRGTTSIPRQVGRALETARRAHRGAGQDSGW